MDAVELRLNTSNGVYICNTYESTSIQISRRVQSLEAIESGQSAYTKQSFNLPLEGDLIEAIGDITDPRIDHKIDIRKNITGSILIDGITEIEGSFNILGATINPNTGLKEVELIFKGQESSIKSKTSNILLSELLAEYTIPYDKSVIANSLAQESPYEIGEVDYIYLLADLGQNFVPLGETGGMVYNDPDNPFDHDNFKPAITFKYILDAIFDELDIEVTWDASMDDLVNNQILYLHNNEFRYPNLDTNTLDYTGRMFRNTDYNVSSGISTPTKIQYEATEVYSSNPFNIGTDSFIAPFTLNAFDGNVGNLSTDITINGSNASTGFISVKTTLFKNNVLFEPSSSYDETITAAGAFTRTINLFKTSRLNSEAGDGWDLRLSIVATGGVTVSSYDVLSTSFFSFVSMPAVQDDSNVIVGANVDEDLTTYDVIKHLLIQTNGIVTPTLSGFHITPWTTWIEEGDELDISNSIDSSKDIEFTPTSVVGGKSIEFNYAESDDFYNDQYRKKTGFNFGRFIIEDTGSDFATNKIEYELPFSSINTIPILQSNMSIPKFVNEDFEIAKGAMSVSYYTGSLWTNRLNIKDKFSASTSEVRHPSIRNWLPLTGGFAGKDINFGKNINYFAATGFPDNTLYNRFYRKYIQESYSAQAMQLKLSAFISKTQLKSLKLNESLYYNGYKLRFNAIESYDVNSQESVKLELVVRTIVDNLDIAPLFPFAVVESVVHWSRSVDNSTTVPFDGSAEPPADVEASCKAYGFFYDSINNIGIEQGQIVAT